MRRFTKTPFAINAVAVLTTSLTASMRPLYSPLVEDHYNNPRNVGKLDKEDPHVGTGLRGAPECGDMTQMQVKVNPETTVIEDVKFKAFGCGSAIAASSYASQAIRGKTLAEALELTNKKIAQELSLPPVKLHCSMLAQETIQAAVENYLSKNPSLKSKVQRKVPGATVSATGNKSSSS
ncbi:NIF system FeS cluster assembly [Trypanosoma melophagium]|uniref:NIF system FeS cluster assembly n=1 Tax=Trypanosoma melophagium TaxID=715481 RepID=UPI00351A58CB|nr:NIF system FeS cluster assembly [Trypanosoma melophagium]